jgi:hypothetical protein
MLYKLIKVRFNFEFFKYFRNLLFFIQVFLSILICYNNGILLAEEVSLDTISDIAKGIGKEVKKLLKELELLWKMLKKLLELEKIMIKDTAKELELTKEALEKISKQNKNDITSTSTIYIVLLTVVFAVFTK